MSPILVRPVREQLEHDRVIRLLQAKSKRRYDVAINPGPEQNAPVGTGSSAQYPDLVLQSNEGGRKIMAVVEVETGESVNHLEALAQWANLAKLRAAFHLYVPSGMVDVARRLCEYNQIRVSEVWSYHTVADDVRFTLIHRSRDAGSAAPAPSRAKAAPKAAAPKAAVPKATVPKAAPKAAAPVKRAQPAKPAKAVKRAPAPKAIKKKRR